MPPFTIFPSVRGLPVRRMSRSKAEKSIKCFPYTDNRICFGKNKNRDESIDAKEYHDLKRVCKHALSCIPAPTGAYTHTDKKRERVSGCQQVRTRQETKKICIFLLTSRRKWWSKRPHFRLKGVSPYPRRAKLDNSGKCTVLAGGDIPGRLKSPRDYRAPDEPILRVYDQLCSLRSAHPALGLIVFRLGNASGEA